MATSGSSTASRWPTCARLIDDVAARPRRGRAPEFGLSAFVIARETEAEAQAALLRLSELAKLDAPIRAVQRANTDPSFSDGADDGQDAAGRQQWRHRSRPGRQL